MKWENFSESFRRENLAPFFEFKSLVYFRIVFEINGQEINGWFAFASFGQMSLNHKHHLRLPIEMQMVLFPLQQLNKKKYFISWPSMKTESTQTCNNITDIQVQ